jgi:uncharacterized protein YciI
VKTRYVVLYHSAEDVAAKAPAHFPAHLARIHEFRDRGEILSIGTFADPQEQGAMAIFPTREAAEAFVADDPFLLHGVVKDHEIREWTDIIG